MVLCDARLGSRFEISATSAPKLKEEPTTGDAASHSRSVGVMKALSHPGLLTSVLILHSDRDSYSGTLSVTPVGQSNKPCSTVSRPNVRLQKM